MDVIYARSKDAQVYYKLYNSQETFLLQWLKYS